MPTVVINETGIKIGTIKQIISFVCPKNTVPPKIKLRKVNTFSFYGAFYYPKNSRRIYASVGNRTHFPDYVIRSEKDQKDGYLSGFWLMNREEALVYLLAHELRHSWQDQHRDLPRIGTKHNNRIWSETDCDTYALRKLNRWRKLKCDVVVA